MNPGLWHSWAHTVFGVPELARSTCDGSGGCGWRPEKRVQVHMSGGTRTLLARSQGESFLTQALLSPGMIPVVAEKGAGKVHQCLEAKLPTDAGTASSPLLCP